MSKTKAHIIILLADIIALFCFWMGYDEINQVLVGIANSANTVEFMNRVGFLWLGPVIPATHLFILGYNKWWHKKLEQKTRLLNWSFIILGVVLFVSAFFVSARLQAHIERAGYLHCSQVDHKLSFSTGFVYTKDAAICDQLIEEKRKQRRY